MYVSEGGRVTVLGTDYHGVTCKDKPRKRRVTALGFLAAGIICELVKVVYVLAGGLSRSDMQG